MALLGGIARVACNRIAFGGLGALSPWRFGVDAVEQFAARADVAADRRVDHPRHQDVELRDRLAVRPQDRRPTSWPS